MRKFKFCTIICMFVLLFCSSISIKAMDILPDGYIESGGINVNVTYANGHPFNYLKPGDVDIDEIKNYYNEGIKDLGLNGKCKFTGNIYGSYGGESFDAIYYLEVKVLDSMLVEASYYYNDELLLYVPFKENSQYNQIISKELDLSKYYGSFARAQVDSTNFDFSEMSIEDVSRKNEMFVLMNLLYTKMELLILYYMDETNNSYSVDYNNPIPKEDIADIAGMTNGKGVILSDYEIIDYTYDENNLSLGKSNIILRAVDSNHNIFLKEITIKAIDYNPINKEDLIINYYDNYNEYDLIDLLNIDIDYDDITFESDYLNNIGKAGIYEYKVRILTLDNCIYEQKANIYVQDKIGPKIIGPDSIETDTENRLMKDDILALYNIYDEYSDELEVDLIELNEEDNYYENNYNLPGIYRFKIIAKDYYDNYSFKEISLYVSQYSGHNNNHTSSTADEVLSTSSTNTPSTSNNTSTNNFSSSSSAINTSTSTNNSSSTIPCTSSNVIPSTSNNMWDDIFSSIQNSNITPSESSSDPWEKYRSSSTISYQEPSTSIRTTTKTNNPIIPTISEIDIPTNSSKEETSTYIENIELETTTSSYDETPTIKTSTSTSNIPTSMGISTNQSTIISSSIISADENEDDEVFRITTSVNNVLTIENIKDTLIDSGIIDEADYDIVTIESDYFLNQKNKGEYLISIKYPNGTSLEYIIEVFDNNTKKNENNNNTIVIVTSSIIGAIAIVVVIIVIVVRRKHHAKKN